MPEYDLFLKLDDDLEISSEKLSKALLGEQPWNPSTLYCFPLTRVPPYRQSWGRNAKMFVPPSIYPPPIYPGNFPWYLFQVLSVNLPLNLLSVPGSYPRYISQVLPDNLPGLLSWMAGGNDSSNC